MSYMVHAVDGADRLTLLGPPTAGGPNLKYVALSYIQAPKLAKRTSGGGFTQEDPCAYEAVELVRSTFIGKVVKFTEDYAIESLQRSAGRVALANGEDASLLLLRHGLATVPDHMSHKMDKALFQQYTALVSEARSAKKGLFASSAERRVRNMADLSGEETAKLGEKLKGTELLVRLEQVLLPTVCLVSAEPLGHTEVAVHMPGVTVKDADCTVVSSEAKFHVERYLLHRKVKLLFEGVDAFGNVLASVTSSEGAFQAELLSRDLVKLNDSTLELTRYAAELRAAEKEARDKGLGLWKNSGASTLATVLKVSADPSGTTAQSAAVSANDYQGPTRFIGSVVQVVSGDTIAVRSDDTGDLVRLSLVGLRSSKSISREQDGRSPEVRLTYTDYEWEAREFLRTNYVGKRVAVQVEYTRQISETKEVRPVALVSVPESGEVINVSLLETGYVTFSLGRNDVCSAAAVLQSASEAAVSKGVGIHRKGAAPVVRILELSHLGATRGKYYLSFLQRGMQGNRPPLLKGVVDVVLGGGSLRVFIQRENFQIPVKVAGIITPMGALGGSSKGEPFAEESKRFAVDRIQQREVEIQVYSADKAGNFIAAVMLSDGSNFAVSIAEAGLATVVNAERLPFYQQLVDAETRAKNEKKYIWSDGSAIPKRALNFGVQRGDGRSLTRSTGTNSSFAPHILSEVGDDGYSVYLQEDTGDVEEKLTALQKLLAQLSSQASDCKPKRGELVAAKYKADDTWNRARILSVDKKNSAATVCFVDFGTKSQVHQRDLRTIPRNAEFGAAHDSMPLARLVRLAFLKAQTHGENYVECALGTMYEYTEGPVLAKEVYTDHEGNVYYTVTVNENVPSLSETLLQRGMALLDRKAEAVNPLEYKRHFAAQGIARQGHKGLWQYGDVDVESNDDT
ncbi:putative RNA-binding protein [Trypanosoma vivax]|nr:putative RNA-binding protein [Trypanosoma vivax]